jgi:hypothetical protein
MYASIRRYLVEGAIQELARRAEEGLVPIFQENPGFVAYYVARMSRRLPGLRKTRANSCTTSPRSRLAKRSLPCRGSPPSTIGQRRPVTTWSPHLFAEALHAKQGTRRLGRLPRLRTFEH